VDKVLADFQKMRGFMQQMTRGGGMPGMPGMPGMGGGGGMPPDLARLLSKKK
jgi:signal recognition particle subunit SRP54